MYKFTVTGVYTFHQYYTMMCIGYYGLLYGTRLA